MEIHKAVLRDLPELVKVTQACAKAMISQGIYQWNDEYPSISAFQNDVALNQLWVLKNDDAIIGSVVISKVMDEEYSAIQWLTPNRDNCYIHRLAVHPDYQGQGMAQQLMNFAENYAKKHKFASVRLDTFSQNARNNRFYQQRGYQKLGDVFFPKQSTYPFHCYELTL
ncbi:MAG: GNAT family N-acetyltransferase [Flavobacteriaceae bacterium]